ncbi:cytochrome c [uncultured Tateyamaria sp.]|uniref:c-type cytochrome n=1 Tax=uncultured Tateyamaria sp. TaxID=455651 RepID=UPI0026065B7F|nr:cytochrome c [uncultured Tateyamaria sp.]
MSKLGLMALWTATTFTLAISGNAQDLGQVVSESDLAKWDISIGPDGVGLPAGSGSAAEGETVWLEQCSACHGEKGKGGPAGDLVGGIGTLTRPDHVKTVGSFWPYSTTLYDYVRRAMPYYAPGSLADDEVYAVVAYLLSQNEIISDSAVMDATSLPEVEMPNADGFISYWPSPETEN